MDTVGSFLKKSREKKGIAIKKISDHTKIKEKFILALEKGEWRELPNYTITRGFAKSYAQILGVNEDFVLALLRRDFPTEKPVKKQEERTLSARAVWTPRTTFLVIILATIVILGAYLFHQYQLFTSPPPLSVNVEKQGKNFTVSGKTLNSATVSVDRHQILVSDDGTFKYTLENSEPGTTIEIEAVSRSGKETTVKKILP